MRSGARLTAGFWFTPQQERGIEASWFGLAIAKEAFSVSTNGGTSYLARPYIDATTSQQSSVVILPSTTSPTFPTGDPTLLDQAVDASIQSQFGSVDVLYKINRTQGEDFHRRYLVGGFRYLMLEDQLAVNMTSSVSTTTAGGLPITSATTSDSFRTLNQFYGGEFGMVKNGGVIDGLFKCSVKLHLVQQQSQRGLTDRQRQQKLRLERQQPIREAFWHRQPIQEMSNHCLPPRVNLA